MTTNELKFAQIGGYTKPPQCLCCNYTLEDLAQDLQKADLSEAIGIIDIIAPVVSQSHDDRTWSGFRESLGTFAHERLHAAELSGRVAAVFDTLYAYERIQEPTINAVKKDYGTLTSLFGYNGQPVTVPIGRALFDNLLPPPQAGALEPYEAIDILVAGVETSIATENEMNTYLTAFEDAVAGLPYSDIGRKRIYEHLEARLAQLQSMKEGGEKGFHTSPSRYGNMVRVIYDGKYLGLFNTVVLDRQQSVSDDGAAWIEEEGIDRDLTGEQIRLTLWGYVRGENAPRALWESTYWTREGSGALTMPIVTADGIVTATYHFEGRPRQGILAPTESKIEPIQVDLKPKK